ncbi:MAG: hypothetical protein V1709_11075, partial [Planctomycetota bacterium]
PESVRIIEYNEEGIPLSEIPYQMDKRADFDPKFNADVNLIWIIRKPLEAKSNKYFCVYFDVVKKEPIPKSKVKYEYKGLGLSKSGKGYQVKNERLKVEIIPSDSNISLIHSWIVRNMSTGIFTNLNLLSYRKVDSLYDQTCFGAIPGFDKDSGIALERPPAMGNLLVRCKAVSQGGHSYLFNFYENLPICEIFCDSRQTEFHNSYIVPLSYIKRAEYLFSNYVKGNVSSEQSLKISQPDTFWLAQKIVNGLTIASLTPENRVSYYLKTHPLKSDFQVSFGVNIPQMIDTGKGFYHCILYADKTEEDTFNLMNRIKSIFTLDNLPVIQRNRTEKLLSNH